VNGEEVGFMATAKLTGDFEHGTAGSKKGEGRGTMVGIGMLRSKPGVHHFELPMPKISTPMQVLVRVKEVGICGTDYGMVKQDNKDMADGKEELVLGHEMLGVVEAVGEKVSTVQTGDYVTMTVRRGCGKCQPCRSGQSDYCLTGKFRERGIHKLDGFLSKYVVDEEEYVLALPKGAAKYGILVEPLSIAEKAIEQARIVQSRVGRTCAHPAHGWKKPHWGGCKTALVIGAGTLGCLTSALLRMNGVEVFVVSRSDEQAYKVKLLRKMGCNYIQVNGMKIEQIVEHMQKDRHLDIIVEAAGASELALSVIPYMSRSSVYVLTGIPCGELMATMDTNRLLRHIVRYNQAIIGSVNSNRNHFQMAIEDIPLVNRQFNNILDEFVTHRFKLMDYREAFELSHPDVLKVVLELE